MEHSLAPVPRRRTEQVVVREFGDETVVYDLTSGEVHCLTGVTARVWAALAQERTLERLAARASADPTLVAGSLDQLDELHLLDDPQTVGMSRRRLLRAAVVGGGALAALPVVQTVLAPSAFAACSAATSRPGTTLALQWAATRAAGAASEPPNGLGGFEYLYGINVTATTPPGQLYPTWRTAAPRRWLSPITNYIQAGDISNTNSGFGLFPRGDVGANWGTGVRYTVPASSTLATVTFAFTSTAGASYYYKNGGAAVVAARTGTFTVGCTSTDVQLHFYVRGNTGGALVPLAVTVTYA